MHSLTRSCASFETAALRPPQDEVSLWDTETILILRSRAKHGVSKDARLSCKPVSASSRLLRGRRLGRAEMRVVGVVDERFVTFGRQVIGEIERALDVAAPGFPGCFVHHLDAVPVRVADIEAVGHGVVDPAVEPV